MGDELPTARRAGNPRRAAANAPDVARTKDMAALGNSANLLHGAARRHACAGRRVVLANKRHGVVRYYGPVRFSPGLWVGVELDAPHEGRNDGSVLGERYFNCERNRGYHFKDGNERTALVAVFVRPERVTWSQFDSSRRSESRGAGSVATAPGDRGARRPQVVHELQRRVVRSRRAEAEGKAKSPPKGALAAVATPGQSGIADWVVAQGLPCRRQQVLDALCTECKSLRDVCGLTHERLRHVVSLVAQCASDYPAPLNPARSARSSLDFGQGCDGNAALVLRLLPACQLLAQQLALSSFPNERPSASASTTRSSPPRPSRAPPPRPSRAPPPPPRRVA